MNSPCSVLFRLGIVPFALALSPAHALLSVDPVKNPEKPRNAALLPIGSLIFPGLGQVVEEQYSAAGFYAGLALTGYGLADNARAQTRHQDNQD